MKLAFVLLCTDTYKAKDTGVWGDEILSKGYASLTGGEPVSINNLAEGGKRYDVAIHTTRIVDPNHLKKVADKNILWIQGFTYRDGTDDIIPLDEVYEQAKNIYDLVITSSRKLAKMYSIPFILPYTGLEGYEHVITDNFYDVSFIGNLIKPPETVRKYIAPLSDFNYGLFGGDFGKVSHEDALKIICGSSINLSFGFEDAIEWDMVTARPFYHCNCEAFTLMDKVPYFMETFGDSMAFTDGGDHERGQIKYYLENKAMRKEKRQRAAKIVKSIQPTNLLKIIKEA
jgi:hypothetical protein